MATCTSCGTPGAYIGFSSIECRNPDCDHFKLEEKKLCPCCGKEVCEAGKATKLTNPCAEIEIDQKDAAKTYFSRIPVIGVTEREPYVNKNYGYRPDFYDEEREERKARPARLVPIPNFYKDGKFSHSVMRQYFSDLRREGSKFILKEVQKNGSLSFMDARSALIERGVKDFNAVQILRELISDGKIVFDKGVFYRQTINFHTSLGNMTASLRVHGLHAGSYEVDLSEVKGYEEMLKVCKELRQFAIDKLKVCKELRQFAIDKQIVVITLIDVNKMRLE